MYYMQLLSKLGLVMYSNSFLAMATEISSHRSLLLCPDIYKILFKIWSLLLKVILKYLTTPLGLNAASLEKPNTVDNRTIFKPQTPHTKTAKTCKVDYGQKSLNLNSIPSKLIAYVRLLFT